MLNIEKKTKWILSGILAISFLSYIFTSLGRTDFIIWLNIAFGILLGLFLYSETAILTYIKQKKYKKVDSGDVLVWLGAVFGTVVILNSIFLVTSIRNVAPAGLLNFLSGVSAVSGTVAGILALLMLWLPKPE